MGRSRSHFSPGQLGLFGEVASPVQKPAPRFRLKAERPQLAENDVERQVNEFLVERGYFPVRIHVLGPIKLPDGRFLRVGKPNMPDWIALRGRPADAIWYELKRPGERPNDGQLAYLEMLRRLGHDATWADSAAMFQEWFQARLG